MFFWVRKFIRNNTKPIPAAKAEAVKKGLSIFYNLLAWNALGFVLYACFSGKADWAQYHGLTDEKENDVSPGNSVLSHEINTSRVT